MFQQAFQFKRGRTANPSCSQKLVSHRGAVTRRGLFRCLVFGVGVATRRRRDYLVVRCRSLEYPKADRAECLRVAPRPLSPAERKKREGEREREEGGRAREMRKRETESSSGVYTTQHKLMLRVPETTRESKAA